MILGLITIGLIYVSNIKTKQYLHIALEKDRKVINVIRVFTILFLMTVYTFGSMISTRTQYGSDIEYNIEEPLNNEN